MNWAVYTVLGRRIVSAVPALTATTVAMIIGLVLPLLAAWYQGGFTELVPAGTQPGPGGFGALLFLGLGCSALAYLLWFAALSRASTSAVAS